MLTLNFLEDRLCSALIGFRLGLGLDNLCVMRLWAGGLEWWSQSAVSPHANLLDLSFCGNLRALSSRTQADGHYLLKSTDTLLINGGKLLLLTSYFLLLSSSLCNNHEHKMMNLLIYRIILDFHVILILDIHFYERVRLLFSFMIALYAAVWVVDS